jgi:hypothetical protein
MYLLPLFIMYMNTIKIYLMYAKNIRCPTLYFMPKEIYFMLFLVLINKMMAKPFNTSNNLDKFVLQSPFNNLNISI